MFVKQIRDIFNFPINPDEVIDELIFLYENENNINENLDEDNDEVFDNSLICYNILKNMDYLEKWRSVDSVNVDKFLKKLDKKIAELEGVMKPEEKPDSAIEKEIDKLDSEHSDIFLKYCPKENFSDYYVLFFAIALLYKTAVQLENEEYDEYSMANIVKKMVGYRLGYRETEEIINKVAYFMINSKQENKILHKEEIIRLSRNYIEDISKKILKKKKISSKDENMLLLSLQFYTFVQVISGENKDKRNAQQNAISIVALLYANTFRNKNNYENGIKFAKIALNATTPRDRLDAYNVLALCAVDNEQYQLAYDAYFSWINKLALEDFLLFTSFEELKIKEINLKLQSQVEEKWRAKNTKQVAIIYGNFAYVCGMMYDTIDESVRKKRLMFLAKHYILKAIELDPNSSSYHCSAGTISNDENNNADALMHYRKYRDLSRDRSNKLHALRSIVLIYRDIILNSNIDKSIIDEFEYEADMFINQYNSCINAPKDKDLKREIVNSRDLYFLFSECEKLSTNSKEIKYILFQIDAQIYGILNDLRQVLYKNPKYELHIEKVSNDIQTLLKEINSKTNRNIRKQKNRVDKIAYYTTLKNLEFLFSEKEHERNHKQLNCLTMMHARYMNDPEEGLTLLKSIKDFLPDAPEIFRNKLYDQKFVFLKSFTGLVDQLNMWTMYGSDKVEGSDCNGCCVCIAPETFEMMVKTVDIEQDSDAVSFNIHTNDDFHLYSVAYIDGKNIIINGKKDLKIRRKYLSLKRMLEKLDVLSKKLTVQDKEIISGCLVRLFEKIMFLFKDISYSLEGESRLIITRDINDREDISRTDQIPPKLYINPLYQIYPEQIILGPKVEDPDYWIPHLQFELSKIGDKWEARDLRDFKPIVRTSEINIR